MTGGAYQQAPGVGSELLRPYRALDLTNELGELATRMSGMEGIKHVVLLSRGFDSVALTGIAGPMKAGDTITVYVEGVGELTNPVEAER